MPGKSFAENMNLAGVMASGLKTNAERVSKRGIDGGFVPKMETLLNEARNLNNEQEALKAKLKTKTDELSKKTDELEAMISKAKKVVKLEFNKTEWKEFGITDAR